MKKIIYRKRGMQVWLVMIIVLLIFISLFLGFVFFDKDLLAIGMVSGTEYISGEEGQIIIRLDYDSFDDINCFVSILFPNKRFFVEREKMLKSAISGNYYFSFETPKDVGIYEEYIFCSDGLDSIDTSSSFHVSTGLNMIAEVLNKQKILLEEVDNLNENMSDLREDVNQKISESENILNSKFSIMGKAIQEAFG